MSGTRGFNPSGAKYFLFSELPSPACDEKSRWYGSLASRTHVWAKAFDLPSGDPDFPERCNHVPLKRANANTTEYFLMITYCASVGCLQGPISLILLQN